MDTPGTQRPAPHTALRTHAVTAVGSSTGAHVSRALVGACAPHGTSMRASLTPGGSGSNGGWTLATLGGAPVIISPTSALLALLVGAGWYTTVTTSLPGLPLYAHLAIVALTVLGVALSVMLHEFAHGLAGTLLGRRPLRYELYLWGGRTTFAPISHWPGWKDAVTSLAGPATNLLLWALLDRAGALHVGALPGFFGALWSVVLLFTAWALAWANLFLAIFNALPALPLDGGHALAALVTQVTGRRDWGQKVAAVGGSLVGLGLLWWYVGRALTQGHRPDGLTLILLIMVLWPILATSARVLGLGRGTRAAGRLDLGALAHPLAQVAGSAPLREARACLQAGAAVVLVTDGVRLLGTIDAVNLAELGEVDEEMVLASQVCQVLPTAAVTTQTTGSTAATALAQARQISRWLIIVDSGRMVGAVPTGAR